MFDKSLLIGDNLSYSIGDRSLFQNLHISLDKEKTGLVGKNGVGKTILIRLLTGSLKPDSGVIYKNCNLGYLPQDFVVYSEKTIVQILNIDQKLKAIERIDSGIYDQKDYDIVGDDWDILQRTKVKLTKFDLGHLDLSRTMGTLSGGEITRVVLVSLLLQNPDFLILDEPTNNLDQESRQALYNLISSFKGGMLIVSHDRKLLSFMDQIIELSSLGAKVYGGNYDQYFSQKHFEQEAKERALSDAEKFFKKTKKTVQTSKEKQEQKTSYGKKQRLSGSHSKMLYDAQKGKSEQTKSKLIQQSEKQIKEAKEKAVRAQKNIEQNKILNFELEKTSVPDNKIVVEIKDLTFGYEDNQIIKDFNLTLKGPKRIAICGPNGSGKTTLLKLITKQLNPTSGSVEIGVERFAYLDQKISILDLQQTILQNFERLNPEVLHGDCRQRLATFLFCNEDTLKLVGNLSGGEKLRVALACVLMGEKPLQLIVLDEPTNNMDLESIASIESALQNYKGALIVVSHDEIFLKNIDVEDKICM